MVPEVRRMFPHVEKILLLLLLSPASSCQAESSFSNFKANQNLAEKYHDTKTISVLICRVHKEKLRVENLKQIAQQFIENSPATRNTFLGELFKHVTKLYMFKFHFGERCLNYNELLSCRYYCLFSNNNNNQIIININNN